MDGANTCRKTIPFVRFNAKPRAQGLECLRSYRTEWDEKARAFRKTPEHNWASHGADAWRYLSLSWRAPMREPEEEKVPTCGDPWKAAVGGMRPTRHELPLPGRSLFCDGHHRQRR